MTLSRTLFTTAALAAILTFPAASFAAENVTSSYALKKQGQVPFKTQKVEQQPEMSAEIDPSQLQNIAPAAGDDMDMTTPSEDVSMESAKEIKRIGFPYNKN